MSDKAAAPARCPLGFTGTPPIGHPSIPGFGSSSGEKLSNEVSASSLGEKVVSASPSSNAWSPATLLTLDAVFLGLCIAVAIWWPQTKALLAKVGIDLSRGAAAQSGANGAAASAAAGVKQ